MALTAGVLSGFWPVPPRLCHPEAVASSRQGPSGRKGHCFWGAHSLGPVSSSTWELGAHCAWRRRAGALPCPPRAMASPGLPGSRPSTSRRKQTSPGEAGPPVRVGRVAHSDESRPLPSRGPSRPLVRGGRSPRLRTPTSALHQCRPCPAALLPSAPEDPHVAPSGMATNGLSVMTPHPLGLGSATSGRKAKCSRLQG